jgi:hypothetical protein
VTAIELIDQLTTQRAAFEAVIAGLPEAVFLQPGVVDDWTIKDILIHLTAWEGELVRLLWQAANGDQPTTVHFGKAGVDAINASFQRELKDRPLEDVLEDFEGVRRQTIRRLQQWQPADLENPKRFPWLKGLPLSAWIAEDTYKHEAEHLPQIQAWLAAHPEYTTTDAED